MKRSMCLVAVLMMVSLVAGAQDAKPAESAKKTAQQTADAMMKSDYTTVIDNTYPKVVEIMGGRDAAIKMTQTLMKTMTDQGMTIISYVVQDAGELSSEGENTFTVIPATLEMKFPKGKVRVNSYLLGISGDGGKTWKLVDGNGLADKAAREKLLPKLPAALKLPENQQPEIIEEGKEEKK
jgi:hypothetical protein